MHQGEKGGERLGSLSEKGGSQDVSSESDSFALNLGKTVLIIFFGLRTTACILRSVYTGSTSYVLS